MDYCRSVLAVAGANFRRLKRDARVWFIFVFTALLIHYYLRPVINYGIDTGTKAPIYIMELLFCSATISVKAPKILFYFYFADHSFRIVRENVCAKGLTPYLKPLLHLLLCLVCYIL